MKTKVMASVLAGVMGVQSTAMATSRVDAVGDAQIAQAQNEIQVLRETIDKLATGVEDARTRVQMAKDDKSATFSKVANVVHIGSAVVGVAVGAFSAVIASDPRGREVSYIIMATLGAGLTTASAVMGGIDDGITSKANAQKATEQISAGAAQVRKLLGSTKDQNLKAQLTMLDQNLTNLTSSLTDFADEETSKKQVKIGREIVQAVGVAMAVYTLLNSNNMTNVLKERLLAGGAVFMSIANLLTALSMFSDDEYDQIIASLDQTLVVIDANRNLLR